MICPNDLFIYLFSLGKDLPSKALYKYELRKVD